MALNKYTKTLLLENTYKPQNKNVAVAQWGDLSYVLSVLDRKVCWQKMYKWKLEWLIFSTVLWTIEWTMAGKDIL